MGGLHGRWPHIGGRGAAAQEEAVDGSHQAAHILCGHRAYRGERFVTCTVTFRVRVLKGLRSLRGCAAATLACHTGVKSSRRIHVDSEDCSLGAC